MNLSKQTWYQTLNESFRSFYKSPATSLVDFLRVGDFGGLGEDGGQRCVGIPDLVFL